MIANRQLCDEVMRVVVVMPVQRWWHTKVVVSDQWEQQLAQSAPGITMPSMSMSLDRVPFSLFAVLAMSTGAEVTYRAVAQRMWVADFADEHIFSAALDCDLRTPDGQRFVSVGYALDCPGVMEVRVTRRSWLQ
uniref:Uncharacterized protein n=1 Tax=Hemiselmis andersenii TaxID=464988 RepID=A0A6T8P8S0_HEMAN|mmetsp:Transcript_4410/g.10402  ORF Transcript_4410/g.10402 Transcript_4410/m.10402 type:complete len:134 (+) Transcript_4410:1925-2326(+)